MLTDALHQLSAEQLRQQCHQEQQDKNRDGLACYELFRRAFDEQDGDAWVMIDAQFRGLVVRWLRQRSRDLDDEDVNDLVSETHERLLRYIKTPIADHYPHLGSLLNYWRQCAFTSAIGQNRKRDDDIRWQQALAQDLLATQISSGSFEDRHARKMYLECVRELIREHLGDGDLRLIVYLRFELELPPRKIVEQYPDRFPDTRTVYNKIDVIKKRLKRVMQAYLSRCA